MGKLYDKFNNEITFDRKNADNPHALVIGTLGTGVTSFAKSEILNLLNENSKDKIVVVDVDGEYRSFAKQIGGEVTDFRNVFINLCNTLSYKSDITDMTDYSSHNTKINSDNRLTVIDLSSMREGDKNIALQLSIMYVWSVMTENKSNGIYTWAYLEGLQSYFRNKPLADTLSDILKRSKEQNGIITGITRDFHNIFANEQGKCMLCNMENLILLSLDKSDMEQIKMLCGIPESFMNYITNQPALSGLIQLGRNNLIPFCLRITKQETETMKRLPW